MCGLDWDCRAVVGVGRRNWGVDKWVSGGVHFKPSTVPLPRTRGGGRWGSGGPDMRRVPRDCAEKCVTDPVFSVGGMWFQKIRNVLLPPVTFVLISDGPDTWVVSRYFLEKCELVYM